MCGIAGIFNLKEESVSPEILKGMLGQIRYRGPDECGVYVNQNVGIGNVRLSIIDLSSGQQPMPNDDKTLWIAYNGEVFNYIELREDLIKKGIHFRTHSDTEVILKYYEYYGEKCLSHFNGQFAFAIWNTKKQELFLARDRVGIRPLYYASENGSFIFGSEIKVILESGKITPSIDYKGIEQTFTFWTSLSPSTCFEGINEIPPGHYAKISKENTEIEAYWSLSFPTGSMPLITDEEEAANTLSHLFEDSVKLRLRADVPVAAYLSGGLDSSTTTYFIKKIAQQHLNTFSIGFADKDFDETVYQNEVAEYLDTQHIGITCTNLEIAESFSDVVWQTESPLLRTAPVPMYLLSKNVRRNNIKVVITGEGADEMLGGYNIFKEMYIRRFWSKYPNSEYRPLLLKKLYPYIKQLQSQNGKMLKFFFGYKLTETDSPIYSHMLRWNNSGKVTGYLSSDITENLKNYNPYDGIPDLLPQEFNDYSPLAKAQWLESRIFMSGYLLSSQGDRMAMANSVEGRYPFLDHRIMEYASHIHPDLKLKGLNEKYILKKMMAGKIPESVLKRSKQAYRAPISESFLSKNAPAYIKEVLNSNAIKEYGIFDSERTNKLIKKLETSPATEMENMALAAIISTQLLYEKFILKKHSTSVDMSDCKIITN